MKISSTFPYTTCPVRLTPELTMTATGDQAMTAMEEVREGIRGTHLMAPNIIIF